ncbi:MAG: VTT domain-containing protein [Minisyncoccia bacterium]
MIPFFDGSINELVTTLGYLGLFSIVFAESGIFLAAFLPGDSLLFTAGILATQGLFNLYTLFAIFMCAAVFGNSFGYWFGHTFGKQLFLKGNRKLFKVEHLERTRDFYEKYGAKSIVFARFVPIVRTFIPIFAGIGEMRYHTFLFYNIIGATIWVSTLLLLGYFLGATVRDIEKYLIPIILVIILVSFAPVIFEFLKRRNRKDA